MTSSFSAARRRLILSGLSLGALTLTPLAWSTTSTQTNAGGATWWQAAHRTSGALMTPEKTGTLTDKQWRALASIAREAMQQNGIPGDLEGYLPMMRAAAEMKVSQSPSYWLEYQEFARLLDDLRAADHHWWAVVSEAKKGTTLAHLKRTVVDEWLQHLGSHLVSYRVGLHNTWGRMAGPYTQPGSVPTAAVSGGEA